MDKPLNLEPRGEALWEKVTAAAKFDPAGYAVLEDACRTADIIARLEKKLHARYTEWLRLVEDATYSSEDTSKLIIVVDHALTEVRQQRLTFRQLMAQLGIGKLSAEGDAAEAEAKAFWQNLEKEFEKGG